MNKYIYYLVVLCCLTWLESSANWRDETGGMIEEGQKQCFYVLRGLARIVPSLLTIPTPNLLAEPSMPRTSIFEFRGTGVGGWPVQMMSEFDQLRPR